MNSLKQKLKKLHQILKDSKGVVIAFSGGVDSSLLLKIAQEELKRDKVLAVTACSPLYPAREIKSARRFTETWGMRHIFIKSNELQNRNFIKNAPNRCYLCKKNLFAHLRKIARSNHLAWMMDGTNFDDLSDYRPGRRAAQELNVRSPLAEVGLTKKEIRKIAKDLGLPNYDKPSLACLASRIPYGIKITQVLLQRIEKAENSLRDLGFNQVRVRDHQEIARIEIEKGEMKKLLQKNKFQQIISKLKELGYRYVTLDLEGYYTGSLNPITNPNIKNTN
ncbi:MAG: ATP-dependent sacrificial sulfur transferase LarE [Candidatus Edwardsbacteria bacterium]